jgi:hypothetical protein
LGWWTFDDAGGSDTSTNSNDIGAFEVGPGRLGQGYSAYFNSTNCATISHIKEYETADLTMSFWMFLLEDSTGSWRTIVHKGNHHREMHHAIKLWPKERRI